MDDTDLIRRAIEDIEAMPRRVEMLGGQRTSYVQLAEVVTLLQSIPVQEPVAWLQRHQLGPLHLSGEGEVGIGDWSDAFPVYAHPVQEPPSPGVTAGATGAERISILPDDGYSWCEGWPVHEPDRVEYIRADLATPAPVVPAEGLDALQRRAYSWQVEHEQGPDTFRDVQNNPAHAHEMLESAHVLIDDLASALRSAPPVGARVTGWQPIETAPKDGVTEVLMYDPGLGMAVWPSSSSPWPNVTHWMPLPDPPAALLPAGEGEE